MKISTKLQSTRYTISLRGELDASTSILVDRAIEKALRSNITQLYVDCEGLRYISSTGLGVFMSYIKTLKDRNVEMKMCGMNARVQNVFTILGLDTLISVVNTRDELFNQEQSNVA